MWFPGNVTHWLWQVSRSQRRGRMRKVKLSNMSKRRAAAAARWSRASRPRPGPPSLACRWPLSSNKPPSWWLIRRVIVDALQAGLRFNFLLLSSDLLRTLGALCENNDYARGWCVCVSLTVLHIPRRARRPRGCRATAACASHTLSPSSPPHASTQTPISILTTSSSPPPRGEPSSPTRSRPRMSSRVVVLRPSGGV